MINARIYLGRRRGRGEEVPTETMSLTDGNVLLVIDILCFTQSWDLHNPRIVLEEIIIGDVCE